VTRLLALRRPPGAHGAATVTGLRWRWQLGCQELGDDWRLGRRVGWANWPAGLARNKNQGKQSGR
jgi:hypothetical protein